MFLLLDLDNTILPSKQAYEYAIAELAKDWNSRSLGSESDFLSRYDLARMFIKKQLGHHSSNRLRLLCFKHMLDEKNGGINGSDIENLFWLEERYFTHFGNSLRISREGELQWGHLFSMLKILFEEKNVLILTNENLRTQLMKLRSFFPADLRFPILTSEEVGLEKPHPDYFKFALNRVDKKSSECMMIGDNLTDDILGANASGISGIHLKSIFGNDLEVRIGSNHMGKIQNYEALNIFAAIDFVKNAS